MMIIRKCETCDILKPAGAWVGVRRSACITHHGCVCFRLKWPVTNGLPRQTLNTQSHGLSYRGHPWHCRTSIQLSEVPQGDLLQAHGSFGFSGQSKWVQMTSPTSPLFLPSLPTSWASLRCWPPAPIAEKWWRLLTRGLLCLRAGKSHLYFGVYQHHLCLCVILKRFWVQIWSASCCSWDVCGNWWCLIWCRATFDPCDLFLSKGMQWAQASSTSHDFSS